MTEDLQTLLRDRAETTDLAPLDVAAITSAGSRRVHRRRGLVVVGTVAAVAVAAGGVALLPRGHHDAGPAQEPAHGVTRGVSWAEGTKIHDGNHVLDVGRPVDRYVRTAAGDVFTSTGGAVWSAHDGTVTEVGVSGGALVSDEDGTLAGWVDGSGKTLSYVVLDQATGEVRSTPGQGRSELQFAPGYFADGAMVAVDGGTAYWRDGDSYYSEDVSDGTVTPLDLVHDLVTVGRGLSVQEDASDNTTVGTFDDRTPVRLRGPGSVPAAVSPDGRWVAFATQEGPTQPQVYSTATGRLVHLDVTAWAALSYGWLDDETVAVLAARTQHTDYQLLGCSVTTASCRVVVPDLGEAPTKPGGGNGLGFRLPTGDYYFPYDHA